MPEIRTLVLNYHEVVEALIKHQNLHEGIWQLYVEFGITAGNVNTGPGQFSPAAIIPISKIGLQWVSQEGPLALDAAKVNPRQE